MQYRPALEVLEQRLALAQPPTPLPWGVVGPALVYSPPHVREEDMMLVSFYGSETGAGTFTFYGQCTGNYEGGSVRLTSKTLNPPINGQSAMPDGTGSWTITITGFTPGTAGLVTATAYDHGGTQRNSLQDTISVT